MILILPKATFFPGNILCSTYLSHFIKFTTRLRFPVWRNWEIPVAAPELLYCVWLSVNAVQGSMCCVQEADNSFSVAVGSPPPLPRALILCVADDNRCKAARAVYWKLAIAAISSSVSI